MIRKPNEDALLDELAESERGKTSELQTINRLLREMGIHGTRVNMSPKTRRALDEIAACTTLDQFRQTARDNRAWRIRQGETGNHEL
ncbi:MAG: hypothetical protein E6R03_02570 [Hyphomicrobiaceae bacterium]|nr:MAG: hypothetical protein E6R03_02570 [Hyphomicrobiaceae bacterium]